MNEYILPILGFISGGGVSTLISARYIRKTSKIDAADKIIKFYEQHSTGLIARIETLESDIKKLKEIRCLRTACRLRITDDNILNSNP